MLGKQKFLLITLAALFVGSAIHAVAATTVTPLTYTYTPENSTSSYTIYFYIDDGSATICNKDGYIDTSTSITASKITSTDYYAGDITIPEKITYSGTEYTVRDIAACAFAKCTLLTSVVLPETVDTIGANAFYNCSTMTKVNIPDSTLRIDAQAFYACKALQEVTFPEKLTYIGTLAFSNCSTLTTIVIPNSVTTIAQYAFQSCVSLKSVVIGAGVMHLYGSLFVKCLALGTVKIYKNGELATYGGKWFDKSTLNSNNLINDTFKVYVLPYMLSYYQEKGSDYSSHIYPFVDRTIGSSCCGTLALPFPATLPDGITAYKLKYYSSSPNTTTGVSVSSIAKDEPVYIEGTAGTTYSFLGSSADAVTDSTTTPQAENLKGNYKVAGVTVPSNGNCYVLQSGVFKKVASTIKIGQFKAYLDTSLTASSGGAENATYLSIVLGDEDEATGIERVASALPCDGDGAMYSLQGVRVGDSVESLPSGVYIRGGKKFVVK